MAVMYLCKYPGCRNLVDKRGYCVIHAYMQRIEDERKLQWYNNSKYKNDWTDWYYTSKWKSARAKYLKENPICVSCGAPATVVDHIIPHRGNEELFWDKENWQSLCDGCHNRKTRIEINNRQQNRRGSITKK
jgi:5-methylcytosine-specific restriction protein A